MPKMSAITKLAALLRECPHLLPGPTLGLAAQWLEERGVWTDEELRRSYDENPRCRQWPNCLSARKVTEVMQRAAEQAYFDVCKPDGAPADFEERLAGALQAALDAEGEK